MKEIQRHRDRNQANDKAEPATDFVQNYPRQVTAPSVQNPLQERSINVPVAESFQAVATPALGYHRLQQHSEANAQCLRRNAKKSRTERERQHQLRRGESPSQSTLSPLEQILHSQEAILSSEDTTDCRNLQSLMQDNISNTYSDGLDDAEFESPQSKPLSDQDWTLIKNFNSKLEDVQMETCSSCQRRWFDLELGQDRRCKICNSTNSHKYSLGNMMDPGEFPPELIALTEAEEMLIARVHPTMKLHRIRNAQYKYEGHICHFMQSVVSVYRKLPRIPEEMNIIILKPAASFTAAEDAALARRFEHTHRVRRFVVLQWLSYLKNHSPAYTDIEIDPERLNALPEDASIFDRLQTAHETISSKPAQVIQSLQQVSQKSENSGQNYTKAPPENEEVSADVLEQAVDYSSFIPTFDVDDNSLTEEEKIARLLIRTELDAGLNQLNTERSRFDDGPIERLSMPTVQSTPLNERNPDRMLFSMAFPFLFPRGLADFHLPGGNRRLTPITSIKDWARHLLQYKDGRFGRHNRFRYVAFNMHSRTAVEKSARLATTKVKGRHGRVVDLQYLQDLVEGNEIGELCKTAARMGQEIPGTRPFWTKRRNELEAMVYNLGTPGLFFTFSAADMRWPDLHQHMPAGSPTANLYAIKNENLSNNPHIAAAYLFKRFKVFFEEVIKKKFSVQDHWFRYEWQQRGSGHIHGFLWLDNAPEASVKTQEKRQALITFWEPHVSALTPNLNQGPAGTHASELTFNLQENTDEALSACLNGFQRHTKCDDAYCLRRIKNTDQKKCRFNFPKPIRDTTSIEPTVNGLHYLYLPRRNDPMLNNYVPLFAMGWRANTDASPCMNGHAVIDYIAKYASKAEQKSLSYTEMFGSIMQRGVHSENPLLSGFRELLNCILVERDWSAQEVCHIMLGQQLVDCSRRFRNLNLKQADEVGFNGM